MAEKRAKSMRKISSAERRDTTTPPDDPFAFFEWSEFFAKRWRRRASGDWRRKRPKPAERNVHRLKRDLYQYYRKLRSVKGLPKLQRYIEQRDGSRWARQRATGASWVIRLVERDPECPLLDKSQRHRMRIEMEFAAASDVRHDMLQAFLREAGTLAAIKAYLTAGKRPSWAKKYSE